MRVRKEDTVGNILKLKEVLEEKTDPDNRLTRDELIARLPSPVVKNTFLSYIRILRKNGMVIEEEIGKNQRKEYYFVGKDFEIYQLKLLVDSVLAVKSLAKTEVDNLVEAIRKLASEGQRERLGSSVKYSNAMDHAIDPMKYNISNIHEAIEGNHPIAFQYGKFNIDKEFELQRGGEEYIYYPYDTVWDQGFYYLIGEKDNKKGLSNYRIDRMRNVQILYNEKFNRNRDYNIERYLETIFHMFRGEEQFIELEFKDASLINPIIDEFGLDGPFTKHTIRKVNDNKFRVRVNAKVGQGLYRWILGWGSNVQVLSPPSLVEWMKHEVQKIKQLY